MVKFEHFNLVDIFKKLHANNIKDQISFELKDQIKNNSSWNCILYDTIVVQRENFQQKV